MPDFDALTLRLKADIRDLANGLSTAVTKVRKFDQAAGKHAKAVGRSFAEMGSRISGGLKSAGQAMSSAGRGIATMGAAVTGATGLMVRDFGKFEQGLSNIEILLGGDTRAMIMIEDQIKSLATTTGISRDVLTSSFFDVQSAVGDVTKSMSMMEAANRLAIAGGSSLGDTTTGLLTLMESYGDTLGGAADGADLLFKAQVKARASIGELAQASGMFLPLARDLGLSAEDVMASFAKMTVGLGNVNTSATAMQGVLNGLLGPTDALQDQMQEWFQTTSQGALAQGKFLQILQKLGGVEKERFKDLMPNVRGLKGLLAVNRDINGVMQTSLDMKNRRGIVDANYLIQMDNLNRTLGIAKENFRGLTNVLVEPLIPAIKEMASETIPRWTDGIKTWISQNEELAAGITKWGAALGAGAVVLGGTLIILGQFAFALGALWPAISGVAGAFGALTVAMAGAGAGMVALIATGGVILVLLAAAVAAIAKTTYEWYKYAQAVKEAQQAEEERADQRLALMDVLIKANVKMKVTYKDLTEAELAEIDALNSRIIKLKGLAVEIKNNIDLGNVSEEQGKRQIDQINQRLVKLSDESMAMEKKFKATHKLVEIQKEETKGVELGAKAQEILNKKVEEATIGTDEYAAAQEQLKKRMDEGLETQDSFQEKMKMLFELTQRQEDATKKQTEARRTHTSAIGQETAAMEKQYRVFVSRPGEKAETVSGFLRSGPALKKGTEAVATAAKAVASAAATTVTTMSPALLAMGASFQPTGMAALTPTGMATLQRGTPFVPETGMYKLHRGEAVTPRGKNEGDAGSITIVNVIEPSMVNGLLDKNLIINTINADIIKRGVTRRVVKGVSR